MDDPRKVHVVYKAEPYDVRIGLADLVAFERRYDRSSAALDDPKAVRVEWIVFLAWNALNRTGALGVEFDEFLANVEEIEFDDDEEEDAAVTGEDPSWPGAEGDAPPDS